MGSTFISSTIGGNLPCNIFGSLYDFKWLVIIHYAWFTLILRLHKHNLLFRAIHTWLIMHTKFSNTLIIFWTPSKVFIESTTSFAYNKSMITKHNKESRTINLVVDVEGNFGRVLYFPFLLFLCFCFRDLALTCIQ